MSVLLGIGDGTFAKAVEYEVGTYPISVAIGDLDGDQVPDLTVANRDHHTVSVLLGRGDGTFAIAVHHKVGGYPHSVAIGDLNGDQVPDLALAVIGGEPDFVSVLLGVGDGTFAEWVGHVAGRQCMSVAIGDLDGDRVLDLAVGNHYSGNVSLLLGLGDGSFAAARHFDNGGEPLAVVIADLDGDRALDLAVANDATRRAGVTVLLNKSLAPGGCARDPEWVCDGDVDGDGQVNPVDAGLVQAAFGSADESDLCSYDVDCDGQINPVDSGIVQSLFGTCEAPREVCP